MLRYIKEFAYLFKDSRKVINVDVFEWKLKHITLKKLPRNAKWDDFAIPHPPLEFTLWQLAHAVVKTDFLIQRNYSFHSLGLILSAHELIKLAKNDNLRLVDDINTVVNDVTLTSLIGRLGQGISLLLSYKLGYIFVGHLASDVQVKAHIAALPDSVKRVKIADFLFENSNKQRVIFESKSSYALQINDPSEIKSSLKRALDKQVDPWLNSPTTNINNGYAMHSALRGEKQPVNSAIIYVDPPGKNRGYKIELSDEWVKVRNYAAWFKFANLFTLADKLMNGGESHLQQYSFRVEQFWGGEFVILNRHKNKYENAIIVGIDLQLMRAIEKYFADEKNDFINYAGIDSYRMFVENIAYQAFNYSVFPDGTLIGESEYENPRGNYQKFFLPG
ncbi:hypothetical protein N4G41_04910 [Kosakonia sacchari]|uniref:hypothetical protein n=1 Tax=Kosakonia sacchari TaxID=1158459 RepID=UPI002ACEA3E6|nr:hypothetical protein [Kosakonia sacchari]MDZ7320971.1 hypothetical protein [Kosakonia sacchari]